MGRPSGRSPDSQISIWNLEDTEAAAPRPAGWFHPREVWQRLTGQRPTDPETDESVFGTATLARQGTLPAGAPLATAAGQAAAQPPAPSPLPLETGRGQVLRAAHRALRDRLRAQRPLRRVLPHLYYVERALARQGSAALTDTPVRVLQRALHQLERLPADNLAERQQFSVLQQRLTEAIQQRSLQAASWPRQAELQDSWMGRLDSRFDSRFDSSSFDSTSSRMPLEALAAGLDVHEVHQPEADDLLRAVLAERDDAANGPGWRRE